MQHLPKASANQRTSYPVQLLTYIMYTYLRIKHAQTHKKLDLWNAEQQQQEEGGRVEW